MSWQVWVQSAEKVLASSRVPPSEEIISLIKRVNPTGLRLSTKERENGYRIKDRLQNLLLENYGAAFSLVPDPCIPDLMLIKHKALPSIDACHTDPNALSARAFDTVGDLAARPTGLPARSEAKAKSREPGGGCSPRATLKNAELLLEQYEYPQAEEILATLRITNLRDLPVLVKAARVLAEEIGAYQTAIEVLLAQPSQVLKDRVVLEILAQSYYGNGMIAEARALFAATYPADLGKSALYAYADISFQDGNLSQAFNLLKLSEGKEGFVTSHASLRKEIEAAMLDAARPYLQQAEAAFARSDLTRAESLLQHAHSLCPNFQQAHRLAEEIEAQKSKADLARLWTCFECSETAADRLDLLVQLSEQDKQNADQIGALIARERNRQKNETVADRLQTLQVLAAQESWEPCFDIVLWLSHQADEDEYRHACSISPFFSLLYRNKKLQRLSGAKAKELWLRFVGFMRLSKEEQAECCWKTVQDLKKYFHTYPLVKEEYDRVAGLEQEKVKNEIQQLLDRLVELEEQEESEGAISEAKRLVAQLRKRSELLPVEDASWYKEIAEGILYRLEPERQDEESIFDYRDYLLLGNSAKAARYKASHDQPWWQDVLNKIDDEIAQMFTISAEPIALTVSPDLVVDLATEPAPTGLRFLCSTERHLLFEDSDETIVIVRVWNMTATRYRSPRFKELSVLDALPDRDTFLFLDPKANNTLWRATLSETESSFTATFVIGEHFLVPAGANINGLFMSSTKDNVYYAFIEDGDNVQAVKQSIDQLSTVDRTFAVKGHLRGAFRLSRQPDRFVISTDDSTTVLESNLTPPRNCSSVGSSQMLYCLGINVSQSKIYALGDGQVNILNPNLRAVKQYLNAHSVAHMEIQTLANICVEKSTVLFNINERGMLYNMETNKFSQKFCQGRLLHSETPSRWYCIETDTTKPAIMIRDMTDEVDSLLEWQVFLSTSEDEGAAIEFKEHLEDPEFFSFVKPADQSALA